MDELVTAINNLSVTCSATVLNESVGTVISSLSSEAQAKEDSIKTILDNNVITSVVILLKQRVCSIELVVQMIAEMAKTDVLRQQCSSVDLIKLLLDIMSNGTVSEATQACRALGNICFDNDIARSEVCEAQGIELLLDLLKTQLNASSVSASTLRKVACGFLFNLTNTHESLIENALSRDVMRLLSDYLEKFSNDEDLLHMVLLAVGSLADCELGRVKFIEYGFIKTIANLLSSEGLSLELQETILDLFANLAETDDIKLLLASPEIFDVLLNLMKTQRSREDQNTLENVTSDLIVLILTGDESMNLVYDNGKGKILTEAINWMRSSSEHLQNSGALAIGNLARSDGHCVQLVQLGITDELLSLLERHPVECGSSVIHHAVFSALRNLAIPAANKQAMLNCQLLERILPYTATPMSTVLFKLLGTLRMIIDGQESAAISLGTNVLLMNKVSDWCNVEDHQGIKGEANRFVASLVKNSRSVDVLNCIVTCGALKFLVTMSASEYVLMQNEAIIALTLISASLPDKVALPLIEAGLITNLKGILAEKKEPVELLRNSLTLVKHLSTLDQIKHGMIDAEFSKVILSLRSHGDEQVRQLASGISCH